MALENRHVRQLAKMSAAVMLTRIELQIQAGDIQPGDFIEDHAPRLFDTLVKAGSHPSEAQDFFDGLNDLLAVE